MACPIAGVGHFSLFPSADLSRMIYKWPCISHVASHTVSGRLLTRGHEAPRHQGTKADILITCCASSLGVGRSVLPFPKFSTFPSNFQLSTADGSKKPLSGYHDGSSAGTAVDLLGTCLKMDLAISIRLYLDHPSNSLGKANALPCWNDPRWLERRL